MGVREGGFNDLMRGCCDDADEEEDDRDDDDGTRLMR